MHNENRFPRITQFALAASALFLVQSALAEDFIKGGAEKFTFNLGGIVNQFDTSVAINGTVGQGTIINLEGNGLSNSLSSVEASGTWRITDRNRVDFLYFSANRSGSRLYDHDITVDGNVIPLGASVYAEAESEFLLLDYRYSFYKTDSLEFAGALGLYTGSFKFNINETMTVGSVSSTFNVSSKSTTVPLPLIGASVDWYIEPRWKVSSALMGMSANVGNVDGSMTVFELGTDYMIARNWGLGMSYLYSNLSVDVANSSFDGNVDWSNNAFMAYMTAKF